jgi:hypothetical protein
LEDSVLLTIGQPAAPPVDLPVEEFAVRQQAVNDAQAGEISVTLAAASLALAPGSTGVIGVRIVNHCASAIRGEAQLISPHGSWQLARPWTTGFGAEAGQETTLRFEVTAPAAARRGQQWWAIVKIMYFGRLYYTEPVEVTIA